VERLLKEYRQNQELVRRIGGHYYQIIYPVQLRHHEKMGISTREVSLPKVRDCFKAQTIQLFQLTKIAEYHNLCFDSRDKDLDHTTTVVLTGEEQRWVLQINFSLNVSLLKQLFLISTLTETLPSHIAANKSI